MPDGDYQSFLAGKAPRAASTGFTPRVMNPALFDFQAHCVDFAIRRGRSALFLDTGLGKTICELEFASQCVTETNKPALILTPLAVARQIEREAERFGYDAGVIRDASDVKTPINICNYDRMDKLDFDRFGTIVLDESSILKSLTGKTTKALIGAFEGLQFKLAATATPAPNDHMELGQHAEFLEAMTSNEMLSKWFINDSDTASRLWRLKAHGERDFWAWVASWARAASNPEDLGYDGSRFVLPELTIRPHKVAAAVSPKDGSLFGGDVSATDMHKVKRQTAGARADAAAAIMAKEPDHTWVIWCDTDYEADALKRVMPDAIEVRGSHPIDKKEESLAAFAEGRARAIITKPSVAGFGCNWQHSDRVIFVGRTFSYEAYYQAIRRCWRFGQRNPVEAHILVAEGELQIGRVLDRKSADHAKMKRAMAAAMGGDKARAIKTAYEPHHKGAWPSWLT